MGALADYAAYRAAMSSALGRAYLIAPQAAPAATPEALSANAAGTPTSPVVCTSADSILVQPPLPATLAAEYWLAKVETNTNVSLLWAMVCDRLSHQGGLSGTVTTAQTTNLPTAALTRYTDGAGVCIGIRIITAIGSTATTLSVSYTNSAGTAGRTSKAITIGGTSRNAAGLFFVVPLADGDTGARSVESVTLAGSTATAGSLGIVLFKPLYLAGSPRGDMGNMTYAEGLAAGKLIEILPNAALMHLGRCATTTAQSGVMTLLES